MAMYSCEFCQFYAALRKKVVLGRQIITGVCVLRCIADQNCVNPQPCNDYKEGDAK